MSQCLGAAQCRRSSDRAPGWRRRNGSVAGARVVVFAEHAALALAVDELQEPADGARTVFFDAQDASGFLLAAQQEPTNSGPTLFFDAPDAPGFLLS